MPENKIDYDFTKKSISVEISVLVVNLNNLSYTKQCIEDLLNQDVKFNLTLIDQNSTEEDS
jgi:GT2 family glycosyltransferase